MKFSICYRIVFYLYFYIFLLDIVQRTFLPTYFSWGIEHSWENYIYSSPTRYGDNLPFAIRLFTTGFPSQGSPYLLDYTLYDSS